MCACAWDAVVRPGVIVIVIGLVEMVCAIASASGEG